MRILSFKSRCAVRPWLALTTASVLVSSSRPYHCQGDDDSSSPVKHKTKYSDQSSLLSLASLRASLPLSAFPSYESLQRTLSEWGSNVTHFQQSIVDVINEVSFGKDSLYRQTVDVARPDRSLNPEMDWDANVRVTDPHHDPDLGLLEKAYLSQRREKVTAAFAKYIGVDPSKVDERDVPVIGVAASGGGYRALVNTLGCLRGAKKSGLLDTTSYLAGISGSCWALGVLYSISHGNVDKAIDHVKSRIVSPFLHPLTLDLLTKPPTNRYLLSGPILKSAGEGRQISIVDLYGTLICSRLLVPDNLNELDERNLKMSSQRNYFQDGSLPLPIYSVIRHALPTDTEAREEKTESNPHKELPQAVDSTTWQWFEMTPFEVGCQALGAWIPTWALGRVFENGKSVEKQPELSLTILYGVFASAFCATLEHYYKEIKPVLQSFPVFDTINNFAESMKKDLEAIHPFPPAAMPNFLKGLHGKLPGCKYDETLYDEKDLGFFDAGALLNIPYVPLFRRNVDVVIALDASADSQGLWFERADQFAAAAGVEGWPKVAYDKLVFEDHTVQAKEGKDNGEQAAPGAERGIHQAVEQSDALKEDSPNYSQAGKTKVDIQESDYQDINKVKRWNCWIGQTRDVNEPDHERVRFDDPTEEDIMKRDGIALVYCPLLSGNGIENVSETWSTWKFDYPKEQTEQLLELAENNFNSGDEKFKVLLRGIWQRKRQARLEGKVDGNQYDLKSPPESWRKARPAKISKDPFN